ncbi:MAG: thiamine phosphate synthase, partial [Candidatus Cloacimonetes bacterium]|nr:thiamine phosphate synthase [Candidatus Cloacimonadota bacterium]
VTKLIINDRIDIAMAVDADGVHLGQDDISPEIARQLLGKNKIIGYSTHNIKQLEIANALDLDYVGIGPVFKTPTKKIPDPELTLELMRKMISYSHHPYFVIGGIDQNNLQDVVQNGAENFCVVRAVNLSPKPEAVIAELQNIHKKYRGKK